MGQCSKLGPLLGVLFIRVPYYIGDLQQDPDLENYRYNHRAGGFYGVYGLGLKAWRKVPRLQVPGPAWGEPELLEVSEKVSRGRSSIRHLAAQDAWSRFENEGRASETHTPAAADLKKHHSGAQRLCRF